VSLLKSIKACTHAHTHSPHEWARRRSLRTPHHPRHHLHEMTPNTEPKPKALNPKHRSKTRLVSACYLGSWQKSTAMSSHCGSLCNPVARRRTVLKSSYNLMIYLLYNILVWLVQLCISLVFNKGWDFELLFASRNQFSFV
jgi:hypothetical protein